MDKYEYKVKAEQIMEHVANRDYKRAYELAEGIEWKRIKNVAMLSTVSEIYEMNGDNQKASEILYAAYDKAPGSRKVVYRLGILALKNHDVKEAADCYEEFVKIAPKDPNQYILKYKILKEQNSPIQEQIATLEEYKKAEYTEKWAYELALLYEEASMTSKCLEECDDLILWFSDGKYVLRAMELKKKYKPLTPLQQERYDSGMSGTETLGNIYIPSDKEKMSQTVSIPSMRVSSEIETDIQKALDDLEDGNVTVDQSGMTRRMPDGELSRVLEMADDFDEWNAEKVEKAEKIEKIKTVVTGSSPIEAVKNGIAMAVDINQHGDKMAAKSEELRQSGQMMIDDILSEWEEKQKENAEAIEKQRIADEEMLKKQKEFWEAKREMERKAEEERQMAEVEKLRKERESQERVAQRAKSNDKFDTGALLGMMSRDEIEELTRNIPEDVHVKIVKEEDLLEEEAPVEETEQESEEEENSFDSRGEEEDFLDGYEEEDSFDGYEEEEEDFEEEDSFDGYEEEEEDFEEEEDSFDGYEEEEEDFEEEEEGDYDDAHGVEAFDRREKGRSLDRLEIEEPTEEEIQKRIRKSKGGVPFDTGFVVTGRYDLSATSEIGLKAGLTEEQKKLFSYFVPVRGMSEKIVEILDNDRRAAREGTSRTGNIVIIGQKGTGKTVLAMSLVKAIRQQRNLKQAKVAIVTGESLNKKDLVSIFQKLKGGAIIIEKAGKLNTRTVKELNYLMEKKTGDMLFVMEDESRPLERLFTANPEFKKKFTSRMELPDFINDELVTFGQAYAKELGYKLDEMSILALYSRIDVMQREDHAVTVAEVKEIMDEAIARSQKANVKHIARRVFGKSTDDSDRIILKEEDFRV